MGTQARVEETKGAKAAHRRRRRVAGLVFRETDAEIKPYDNHHIQVFASFSGPHKGVEARPGDRGEQQVPVPLRLHRRSENGKELFQIEHEVRSMTHPMYARPLVNRDPQQNNRNYAQGHDAWIAGVRESMDNPRDAVRRRL